jgi:hypothetical protein
VRGASCNRRLSELRLDSRGIVKTFGPDDRGELDSFRGAAISLSFPCRSELPLELIVSRSTRPWPDEEDALPRFDSLGIVITVGSDERGESASPLGTAMNLELL